MTTAAHPTTTPTFGWDTVFAIPIERVNQAIATNKVSPAKLDYKSTTSSAFQMQADFDDWQVIPEGDGPIVRMALPMKNLAGSYVDTGGQSHSFTCAEFVGVIEVKLNFLPHDGTTPLYDADGNLLPPPPAGTRRQLLLTRIVSNDASDPVVTFVTMTFAKPLSLPGMKTSVEAAFLEWCGDNLQDFAHVFAIVDLNDRMATGKWAFCKPHVTNYAVVDKIDKSSAYLGILCMTSGDPVPDEQQISAFAIPANCSAAFLISPRRVLEDIARPSMTSVWPKLDPNDLEVDSSGQLLSLKSGVTAMLPDITTKQGDTYTPVMTSFSLEIMGDEMKIDTHIEVEVSLGIYATCTSTYYYKIGLGTNSSGEPALVYTQSRQPVKTQGSRASPGIVILQTILTVIAIVLAIVMLAVDPAVSLVISVVLVGIAVGQYEIKNIQISKSGDAPGLGDLRDNFTAPIVWTDTRDFTLKSVGMSESLQLGGVWN
ncbi:TULIP family P47-like protein [Bradyrhizobium manausense]|uniref:TULIP family P47-like protein n=1 Tax=Bradyrhizobium manausense TaxID=989370 RepID=UPI001BAD85F7|nr:TULIP family P47-like protein [Bradyrhizobium manausense]MBR1086418.1 TULIP family P47-like protein [Bradyrhizobium manausense]